MKSKPHNHLLTTLTLLILPLTLLFAPPVSSEGTSCHGKGDCGNFLSDQYIPILGQAIYQDLDNATTWKNGQNIACVPDIADISICVWVWNTDNTTTGAEVKDYTQRFFAHGCKVCGNVAMNEGLNNIDDGELTFGSSENNMLCDGVCNAEGGSDYKFGQIVPSSGGLPTSTNT